MTVFIDEILLSIYWRKWFNFSTSLPFCSFSLKIVKNWMEGILCFVNITLGDATEKRTTQLKTFKNFFILWSQVRGRSESYWWETFYLYGFLALVLQVFHLAERAAAWWTRRTARTRRTSGEEDCLIVPAQPRVDWTLTGGQGDCSLLSRLSTSSNIFLPSPHHLSLQSSLNKIFLTNLGRK